MAFDLIDLDGDRKITFEEFQNAAPMMKKWGLDMSNPKEAWKEVDTDNFGKVLFDEFSVWAIKKSLDLDDDDDVPDSDIEVVEIDRQAQANKYLAEHKQKQAQKAKPKRKTYDTKIWAELKRKLPFENNPKDAKLRDEQWRVLDNNKNGIISLAEFEKGLVDTLNLP